MVRGFWGRAGGGCGWKKWGCGRCGMDVEVGVDFSNGEVSRGEDFWMWGQLLGLDVSWKGGEVWCL